MEENKTRSQFRWYQTWWGVSLLGFSALILAVAAVVTVMTARYFWQIKSGGGEALRQEIYGQQEKTDLEKADILALRQELETADSPFLGNPKAEIVIVEFVDFKCPNCLTEAPILRQVAAKYGYKTKIIARQFPAESIHSGASRLSEMAICAQEQNRFWEFYDLLFARQNELPAELTEIQEHQLADEASLNWTKLKECLDSGRAKVKVNRDYAAGYKYEIKGTPTFFVNGEKAEGAITWEIWENFLKNF